MYLEKTFVKKIILCIYSNHIKNEWSLFSAQISTQWINHKIPIPAYFTPKIFLIIVTMQCNILHKILLVSHSNIFQEIWYPQNLHNLIFSSVFSFVTHKLLNSEKYFSPSDSCWTSSYEHECLLHLSFLTNFVINDVDKDCGNDDNLENDDDLENGDDHDNDGHKQTNTH